MVPLHNFVVKPVTSCMHVHSMEGCISEKRQAFIKKCIGCYLFQCPIFFFKQDIPRWGEETRFGTKRWSHNLQSKYFQTFLKQEANRQRKSEMLKKLKKIISCIFFFLAYRMSFGTEIAGETITQPSQILTNNNALDRFIYRLHCFCRARIT